MPLVAQRTGAIGRGPEVVSLNDGVLGSRIANGNSHLLVAGNQISRTGGRAANHRVADAIDVNSTHDVAQ